MLGQGRDVRRDPGVEPRLAADDVLGMHGEPRGELEAALSGDRLESAQAGPGPLGVHVVGRERRDTAPVVDAGVEQGAALLEIDQVGRGLNAFYAPLTPGDGLRYGTETEITSPETQTNYRYDNTATRTADWTEDQSP